MLCTKTDFASNGWSEDGCSEEVTRSGWTDPQSIDTTEKKSGLVSTDSSVRASIFATLLLLSLILSLL